MFGFTDHDRALAFDGTTFESESGLIPSELRHGSDLAVDAQRARDAIAARRFLAETDWVVIRAAETGKPMPEDVAAQREAARKVASA